MFGANVFAEGHRSVVLIHDPAGVRISRRVGELVINRVRAEIDQRPGLEPLFGEP